MVKSVEITLPSGRRLDLHELRQYLTYEGLLEGLPTAERNKEWLEQLVSDHRDTPYPGGPYLIQPAEKPIEYLQGQRYPFGTPSALPRVTCIGRIMSLDPVRDEGGDFSGLVVIWFQEEFACPIDPAVVSNWQLIDWDQYAANLDY